MEPVPGWVRVTGLVVAVATGLVVVPLVLVTATSLASTVAQVQRTTTLEVGPGPRLHVDARFGSVAKTRYPRRATRVALTSRTRSRSSSSSRAQATRSICSPCVDVIVRTIGCA